MHPTLSIIFGHAMADALGVPVEFQTREQLRANPVTDSIGYGTYAVPEGTWSDDTSMTIATLDSLAGGVDYHDVMERFCNWMNNAQYTATGVFFDIGITTRNALNRYLQGLEPLDCGFCGDYDNGNGSLMRIAPAAIFARYKMPTASYDEKISLIHDFSSLTHGHPRSQMGCGIYAFVLWELLDDPTHTGVKQGLARAYAYYNAKPEYAAELKHYQRMFEKYFSNLTQEEIKSTGYVVHSLEAALWCLLTTDSYRACVLKAVNLGGDTDTVAAIAGGLAGALYGYDAIPMEWLAKLKNKELIREVCGRFEASC